MQHSSESCQTIAILAMHANPNPNYYFYIFVPRRLRYLNRWWRLPVVPLILFPEIFGYLHHGFHWPQFGSTRFADIFYSCAELYKLNQLCY
jgi:hypothetical protein